MNGWMLEHGYTKTLMRYRAYPSLPFSEHTYQQAPYQDIEEAKYYASVKRHA